MRIKHNRAVIKDEMMCRIDPEFHETAVEMTGCSTMDFTRRPMKGYVMIEEAGMRSKRDFDYWIDLALEFNKKQNRQNGKVKITLKKLKRWAGALADGIFTFPARLTFRGPQ